MHFWLVSTIVYNTLLVAGQSLISWPSGPPNAGFIVPSNFFGISFELSSLDNYYFGNSTSGVPSPVVRYLSLLRARTGSLALRLRLGGNSMDNSRFAPNQTETIIEGQPINEHDVPTTFGPSIFSLLRTVGSQIGGVKYTLGLSMRYPNDTNVPVLSSFAIGALGDTLDEFLLGNEPDLYTAHLNRLQLANYTTADYMAEFRYYVTQVQNASDYNRIPRPSLGAPTICCDWDLQQLFNDGFLANFTQDLTYISLQHYPQNNCNGTHQYGLDLYLQHNLVVSLASWQAPGIASALAENKPIVMSEFNTASCGGIPNISDTFAAAMWTVDYSLQLASIGYTSAFIHTRERGVTYNLFETTDQSSLDSWRTLPSYYASLAISEILASTNGSIVTDLDIESSRSLNGTQAGYAIYDPQTKAATRLVLFNYADAGSLQATYELPGIGQSVAVRYLRGSSLHESTDISWGGKTFAGVTNGVPVKSHIHTSGDTSIQCVLSCLVHAPSPGVAVVWLDAYTQFAAARSTAPSLYLPLFASVAVVLQTLIV